MQAAKRVVQRIAKPRAHGSIPAIAAGRPGSEDTVTAPAGAGASHIKKWFPETKNGHAGCQKGRLDWRIGADLSQQLWQACWTGTLKVKGYPGCIWEN